MAFIDIGANDHPVAGIRRGLGACIAGGSLVRGIGAGTGSLMRTISAFAAGMITKHKAEMLAR